MNLVFVWPVYNEEAVIGDFLLELDSAFREVDASFIVVNDKSTDGSQGVLLSLKLSASLEIIDNDANLGHGRSLLKGLDRALQRGDSMLISIDGDGHFSGSDIKSLYYIFKKNSSSETVLEGVRIARAEPIYRKLVSLVTRYLILQRSGSCPKDANTPLRIYNREALSRLFVLVSRDSVIPNLHFSHLSRIQKMNIMEENISWINRKGFLESGSSWKPAVRVLPSRRFISFCLIAIKEWISLPK